MYKFIGPHEILASLATAIFLIIGLYLALVFNATWLNRAGALVVIVGVLLAKSRFHEMKLTNMFNQYKNNFEQLYEERKRLFDAEDKINALDAERKGVFDVIDEIFDTLIKRSKNLIKNFEIFLIVLGTFLNGFGDLLIDFLRL